MRAGFGGHHDERSQRDERHIDTAQIETDQPDADALVLFGATGDLAKRKLFPALYRLQKSRSSSTCPVIGVARSDWTDDDFRRMPASRSSSTSPTPTSR